MGTCGMRSDVGSCRLYALIATPCVALWRDERPPILARPSRASQFVQGQRCHAAASTKIVASPNYDDDSIRKGKPYRGPLPPSPLQTDGSSRHPGGLASHRLFLEEVMNTFSDRLRQAGLKFLLSRVLPPRISANDAMWYVVRLRHLQRKERQRCGVDRCA